jgi:hypothetical protein
MFDGNGRLELRMHISENEVDVSDVDGGLPGSLNFRWVGLAELEGIRCENQMPKRDGL